MRFSCRHGMIRDMETENPMHRLLIVDDDNDIRTLLAEQLGRAGYQVSTAESAEVTKKIISSTSAMHDSSSGIGMLSNRVNSTVS